MLTVEMTKLNNLIARGKFPAAVKQLRKMLEHRPNDPLLRKQLGNLLPRAGERDEGIKVLYNLAHDYARQGFFTKGIAILKKMQRMFPEKAEELEKGIALLTEKDRKAAEPDQGDTETISIHRGERDTWEIIHSREEDGEHTATPDTDTLLDSPLFKGFKKRELHALIAGLVLREFEPGEIIFSENEPGSSLMVLVSGRLRVYVRNRNEGNEQIRILEEGAFFGEISLLSGNPRTATITCSEKAEILELSAETLTEIAAMHPEIPVILGRFYKERADSAEERQARES